MIIIRKQKARRNTMRPAGFCFEFNVELFSLWATALRRQAF